MESREQYLSKLREYIDKVENEVTIILQSLQWTSNTLLKPMQLGTCKYDSNHIMPFEKLDKHEEACYLNSKGYSKDNLFLPEPLDPSAPTVVKLTTENINNIIENAAKCDPLFKRGIRHESEPLSLAELQATYTADERRAIHDAVVNMVPSPHDLVDLTLASDKKGSAEVQKSREQVLAELRDTKRRRPRYRGAPQRNYSHELRQVIASQMEVYTDEQVKINKELNVDYNEEQNVSRRKQEDSSRHTSRDRREKERVSHGREDRSGGRFKRERSLGSKRDNYNGRRRDDIYYKRKYIENKYERDDYRGHSRNGKRRHEGDEINDSRVKREHDRYYDKRHKYDKYTHRSDWK